MEYQVEKIEGIIFHIYTHTLIEEEMLLEAKSKGNPLDGTYSFLKHQPHNSTGEYHLHVYDRSNEIFAINQSGKGHDGYSGTSIPKRVYNALVAKFPHWNFPANRIIESIDDFIMLDFRQNLYRPVIVFPHGNIRESFTGYFHQFAEDPFSTGGNGGYFANTKAIIEKQSGRVIKIPVDKFRFTDVIEE